MCYHPGCICPIGSPTRDWATKSWDYEVGRYFPSIILDRRLNWVSEWVRPIWRDPSKPFLGTQQLTAVLPSQILSTLKITQNFTSLRSGPLFPQSRNISVFFKVQGLGSLAWFELLVLVQTCLLLDDVISGFGFWLQNMGRWWSTMVLLWKRWWSWWWWLWWWSCWRWWSWSWSGFWSWIVGAAPPLVIRHLARGPRPPCHSFYLKFFTIVFGKSYPRP